MREAQEITPKNKENDKSLKGTFASVLVVAAIIVVMWAGVFLIYMDRV
ncbi:cytochrome c oxidase subunit 2A [Lentibacillus salicampi]|uniref:Cytochrome c oxidase subunit 2A n=1 Tax=Lentibacillus salicampi TaxID=175306 RepID=A0A4Y9AEN7_9BACI|nr:cytochrome c oxidase subunit 2A [Lentibacillus salicampi]TFJ93557.1 cytochrome c oxidase subunit 2A [Lentibacillus salicampi]